MKRDIHQALVKWKDKSRRKPLILRGARQIGKTWSINQFAKDHYAQLISINF